MARSSADKIHCFGQTPSAALRALTRSRKLHPPVRDCKSSYLFDEVAHGSIKVVIADDHPVVLHGLVSLLSGEPDFRVVAACTDGAAALEAIFRHSPEIALLDLRLPKMTGLDVLDKVSNEKTRVVILTAFAEDRDVLAAVNCGVSGIVMKDSAASALITCLRRVGAGYRCVPPELVREELHRVTEAASVGQLLTSREREVMCLVASGFSNKRVANLLKISEGTVKLHLHHIYCKTGVNSRSALMALALRLGGMRANHNVTESHSFVTPASSPLLQA